MVFILQLSWHYSWRINNLLKQSGSKKTALKCYQECTTPVIHFVIRTYLHQTEEYSTLLNRVLTVHKIELLLSYSLIALLEVTGSVMSNIYNIFHGRSQSKTKSGAAYLCPFIESRSTTCWQMDSSRNTNDINVLVGLTLWSSGFQPSTQKVN